MYLQQGDVLIFQEKIPQDCIKVENKPLALGEKTGHHHSLYDGEYEMYESPKKEVYLRVVTPCELRHQEHKPFIVSPGDYKIGIVREYDHFKEEARRVAD